MREWKEWHIAQVARREGGEQLHRKGLKLEYAEIRPLRPAKSSFSLIFCPFYQQC